MAGAKKAHKASGGATSSGGGGAAGKGSKASLAVKWPEGGGITRSWLRQLASALDHASRHLPPEELPSVIPVETADAILMSAHKLLHKERNIVRVDPATPMSAEAAAAAAATTGSTEMKERRSLEASAKTKQQPLNDASSTAPYTHDSAAVAAEGAQDNAEELAHIPGSDSQGQGGAPDREIAQQARSHGKPTEGEVKAENTSSGDKSEREDGSVHASTEKVEGDSGDREGGGQRGEGKGGEEEGPADSSIAEWEQESHAAAASNVEVVVVGDVHGQLHDVLNLFKLIGDPGSQRFCVFNGDYVDRGSWGVETYLYLLAWKVFAPERLVLLRGNHESKFCVSHYGFERELQAKYGADARHLFRRFLACFESHPVAAVIAGSTFVCHGGLFRKPAAAGGGGKGGGGGKSKGGKGKGGKGKGGDSGGSGSGKNKGPLTLGSLRDLETARRSFLDPSGSASDAVLSDVLWSDPALKPGLSFNTKRGIGLVFGPDCTQEFLKENKLRLVIRSHEGPDAREKRPEMQGMRSGYTEDHSVESGRLVTLFSAPDYPQFQGSKFRFKNRAAFVRLHSPGWDEPKVEFFDAVTPRPKATAYYDYLGGVDSDSDLSLDGSDDESSGWGSDGSSS